MPTDAEKVYAHPELEGRPVLIGDRLKATVEIDVAGPNGYEMDVEFVVTSIVSDSDSIYGDHYAYGGHDGEEYYLLRGHWQGTYRQFWGFVMALTHAEKVLAR